MKMKPKLIITYGLPASGKSTWSKKMVEDNPDTHMRVNKDDLRAMMFNSDYTKEKESMIEDIQDTIILEGMTRGEKTVIVDNTHIAPRWIKRFKRLAEILSCRLEIKRFDVPVEVCIERDSKRKVSVGKDVILKMFNQMEEQR